MAKGGHLESRKGLAAVGGAGVVDEAAGHGACGRVPQVGPGQVYGLHNLPASNGGVGDWHVHREGSAHSIIAVGEGVQLCLDTERAVQEW